MTAGARATDTKDTTLWAVLAGIREGRWQSQIEAVRQATGEQREQLKKNLPAVMFSGRFSKRKAAALVAHSGLLCADLDHLGARLDPLRDALAKNVHVVGGFVSPSGNGLKILFKVPADGDLHAAAFEAVRRYCWERYRAEIDKACSDVSRLCFVSFDPGLWMNLRALEFPISDWQPAALPATSYSRAVTAGATPTRAIQSGTATTNYTLPPSAQQLFDAGPVVGQRNNEAFILAVAMRDAGWPEDVARERLREFNARGRPPLPDHEIESCLRSAYTRPPRERARNPKLSVEDANTLQRLAAMSPLAYDRCREAEAERLGVRVATLDREVDRLRTGGGKANQQGRAVAFPPIEPWPDPVAGAALLLSVAEAIAQYVVLPEHAAPVIALWAAHTHCFEAFVHSPRLNLFSPEKGCGKTLLLDLISTLVARPKRADSLTSAVLFRMVELFKPTLLLDELDTYLPANEDLRGILNAGHKRGATVFRCDSDSHELREFAAFAPAVLAGIGPLPATLHDRAIVIRLTRAKPGEVAERFDSRRTGPLDELARQLARWTGDHAAAIAQADPAMPANAPYRVCDNWRPLFALAEVAGGVWPALLKKAFDSLSAADDADAHGTRTDLLCAIRDVFLTQNIDRITSQDLADTLAQMEGTRWPEYGRAGRPVTPNQVARLLRPFGVQPGTIRLPEGGTLKGYYLASFADAFARYLPSPPENPPPNRHAVTTIENKGDSPLFEPSHEKTVLRFENATLANKDGTCDGVTVQKGGGPEGEKRVVV
jgi:putative DNA primase/helicase